MSVPPEVMQRMMSAQGGGASAAGQTPAAAGGPAGAPGAQQPSASPTPQVQEKKGLKAAALSNLKIAQNMLEQALTAFQPEDQEYKVALDCLGKLAKIAGKSEGGDLVPAQVMRMVGQLPQMGGGSDMQRAIMQQLKGQQQPQQPQGGAPGAMQ